MRDGLQKAIRAKSDQRPSTTQHNLEVSFKGDWCWLTCGIRSITIRPLREQLFVPSTDVCLVTTQPHGPTEEGLGGGAGVLGGGCVSFKGDWCW